MKRLLVVAAVLFVSFAFGLATVAVAAEKAKTMTMTGTIIDTKCATANKDKLDEFVKTHPKECAMACKDTGYNLYSDGKLWKFDEDSNEKVHKFLKKADSKLHVKAEIKHEKGDKIKLVSIANAE